MISEYGSAGLVETKVHQFTDDRNGQIHLNRPARISSPRFLVTADDVVEGKPDPDPSLLGAERMGSLPGRCLVFEDATAGVTAAQAAGVRVVGLLTTHPQLVAPVTLDSLADVEFSADRAGVVVSY